MSERIFVSSLSSPSSLSFLCRLPLAVLETRLAVLLSCVACELMSHTGIQL